MCLVYGCQLSQPDPLRDTAVSQDERGDELMNIVINEQKYKIELYDHSKVEEFIKLLPMTLQMEELHGNEKYYYLDQSLPIHPESVNQIKVGDIMLFQDNCLVLFYKDFQTSYQYTRIGHIEDVTGLSHQLGNKSISVTFQKEENE